MGGRGTASYGSSLTAQKRDAVTFLKAIAENYGSSNTARDREFAEIANAAAGMVDNGKAAELNADKNFNRILFTAKEWGHPFSGHGEKSMLDNALSGDNKPMGMEDSEWQTFGRLVKETTSRGFTTAEIAALLRFDERLYEVWR